MKNRLKIYYEKYTVNLYFDSCLFNLLFEQTHKIPREAGNNLR